MSKQDKQQLAAGAAAIKQAEANKKNIAKGKTTKAAKGTAAMEIHPVAKMFPMLPAKEMRELKASIEANGIEVPILVTKTRDVIIDGRNRWMIAQDLGLSLIPMEVFKGKDEEIPNLILMRNVYRRHLTPDQRVALIAKITVPQLEAEATDRKAKKGRFGAPTGDGNKGSVAEHVAKQAEVSTHKAKQAVRALKTGQIDEVIEKKKTLKQAAKAAPAKPRKVKEKTFEDIVWAKWDRFLKSFDPGQRAKVKAAVRGFLIEDAAEKK